jgi:NAD(P)-dependent dehydrogenase (short-subunit alcohol dehydrogenase family)
MDINIIKEMYDFTGKTVVITGGAGVLCREMVFALLGCNANVVVVDRDLELAEKMLANSEHPKERALALFSDVLKPDTLQKACDIIMEKFGTIDCLINGAGGNNPKATTNNETTFFDLPPEALQFVLNLNLLGTFLPSQIFGKQIAKQKEGVILNISSMNAFRPLTRIPAYSASKAGISNFTQWLAVYLAQEFSSDIRVNAIAPGFFLTEQNRFLLTEKETGALTERGKKILDHTPMGRFGSPEDLLGAVLWLLSPASNFVTGIVVPIDGGFSAYSGV